MSKPEIRKRHVQSDLSTKPKHKARTVMWHQVSEWQQDNKYILSGYRPEKADYLEIFTSLTFLHNETCNVYTHMIGGLLLPIIATSFMWAFSDYSKVSETDYFMLGFFFGCAECCMVFSATYHLMGPHSREVEQFWHRMDLLGIVIVIVRTFVPGIYYVLACDPDLQKLHWIIILISASATAVMICIPNFGTLRWRTVRVGAFFALGASAFIPLLHRVQLNGLDYMLQYSGMRWYLLELVLYGGGVGLHGSRTPERFAPGKFDMWGSSHQIFHVAILCAMYVHAIALTRAFTMHNTLDLCRIQAAYRQRSE